MLTGVIRRIAPVLSNAGSREKQVFLRVAWIKLRPQSGLSIQPFVFVICVHLRSSAVNHYLLSHPDAVMVLGYLKREKSILISSTAVIR